MEQISYSVKGIFFQTAAEGLFAYSLTGTCDYMTLLSALLCASKRKEKKKKKTAGVITFITLNAYKAEQNNSVGIQRIECGL